jgi:hypothetical protein
MPNPFQNLDRTLPARLDGGDPAAGLRSFINDPVTILGFRCNTCHRLPGPGTTRAIQAFSGQEQPFKIPHLRNVYQKLFFSRLPGTLSMSGFGVEHDGSISSIFDLLSQAVFPFLRTDFVRKVNIAAFVRAFDTGTAPAVGHTRTLDAQRLSDAEILQEWVVLEQQAVAGNSELILTGLRNGQVRALLYDPPTNKYLFDSAEALPVTRLELIAGIAAGDVMTFMGVAPGTGRRMALDRDLDGILNAEESGTLAAAGARGPHIREAPAWALGRRIIDRIGVWVGLFS